MRKLKLFFACLLMAVLSIGQVWGAVVSGTTYTTDPKTPSVPTGWTVNSYANDANYTKLASSSNYIQTDEFCQNGFTSIKIKARKFGGPSAAQAVISIDWWENGASTPTTLATVSPTSTTLTDYTVSDLESVTGNKNGSIKISCKAASGGKGCGVSQVTITYTAGSCGGGEEPTACADPTFSPAAGSYEGTQTVTISCSTDGAAIHYTTDGTDPTASSPTYSTALSVSATQTIKAIAMKDGLDDSEIVTAAYTITEGPDVTLDLIDGNWGFPTSNTTEDGTYTNSVSGYSVTCHAPTQYKVSGSDYFFIGKSGAYILLPEFDQPIEKIVVVGNSAGSGSVIFNVFDGDDAVSTAVTGCTSDKTFEIENPEANKQYSLKVTSAHNLQLKKIKIYFGAAPTVATPTISGETPFLNTTSVSISIPEGATVYYTTDGSTPTDASSQYSAPFALNNSATVKAIAKIGSDYSAVAEKAFTKATVMTVAQARAAIDAGGDLSNKYVAGIISQIDGYNSTYHSITYWISDDGTTTDQLEVYSGLAGVVKEQFTSVDDLAVGDDVTVKGTLKKYNSTYEFDYNNTIEAYKPIARLAWSAESYDAALEGENTFPSLTNTNGVTVSYSSSDPTKASFADASVYEITLNAAGSTTITATFAGNETYKANSASYTLNVVSSLVTLTYNVDGGETIDPVNVSALPNPLPATTKAGKNFGGWFTDPEKEVAAVPGAAISENTTLYAKWLDPYTVAEAKAVIDANPSGIENQYVAGIISQIDSYNNTYHSITYWISADGTTTNQLQVYSGLIGNAATALGKEAFSAKEDLELGDEVVVTGTLKLHNSSVYEFDKNNTIYTFSRKASAGLEYAVTAVNKVVGDDAFVNELTNPNGVAVTYGTSNDQVAEVANDGTVTIVGEGSATITASFAGNAQYKAAQVSYTLTVSATVDNRKVANSPAAFTTISGDLDPADIAFEAFKGGAGTAPGIYNSGIRLYQAPSASTIGGYITLTAKAGCTIDEVQITTTSTYATTIVYSVDGNETLLKSENVAKSGSYTTGTGLNVSSVNIVNKGTSSSGRLEIASIKVYYTGEPASIHHYVLGGTYQTAFMQGDEFNHTGLIVYAAYDELEETKVDITSMCTFSEPDMSTTGDKTIEITYNEAVVTSYTINVAADSRKVANSPATFTTVSGDMTPNDITFASYQGDAGTAPANYNDGIRLYQAPSGDKIGGFITLKAKKGCTIDQVKITTTNTYATTVAYSVDGNENLLGSESVAKSSDYTTPSGLNVESVNIVNKGTGSNGRLEIASIKVWYTGDALPVHHYILGGTYATEFEQYGEFNYEGLTVTAAYDELETITEAVTGFTVEADLNTAGAAKANVMLNSVKITEYDITVTASAKEDPALAYSPASVILTLGDALSAPTFSNTYNVSPISYESSKPAVATVDAEGNITLAGGTGVAVITASFAGDDNYIESEATFTITVNEPTEDLSGTWVKATSVVAGDRIIVGATVSAGTKTMGLQNTNNRAAVASTYEDLVLTPADGTKTFLVVDAGDGKFALQALNGKYLTSATSGTGNNLLEAANYENDNAKWTITIDGEGVASVVAAAGNRTYMKYNNGSTLFSCYQYETSQSPINIYKKGTPDYGSYQRDVTNGNYGTICLPKAGTISGAKLLEVAYKGDGKIYCDEILSGEMEAGKPYIFQATSDQLNVVYSSSATVEASHVNGLYGFYNLENMATDDADKLDLDEDQGNYILYQNAYWLVSGRAAYINNFRAYIKLGEISTTEPTPTPGQAPRRRVAMTVNGSQVATGFENIKASEKPMKMMINGQIYILRGEKMYDATGRLVK